MGSSVNDILAGAKKTLSDADNKFPSSQAKIATSSTPNEYSHAPYSLVGSSVKKPLSEGAELAQSLKEKAANIKRVQQ
jgi:hypothetical protein